MLQTAMIQKCASVTNAAVVLNRVIQFSDSGRA